MRINMPSHDECIEELLDEIEDEYVTLEKEVVYKKDWKHDGGDLDVMAIDEEGNLDIYEVKSGSGYQTKKHARQQLRRAYEHYNKYFDVTCYLKMAENQPEKIQVDT